MNDMQVLSLSTGLASLADAGCIRVAISPESTFVANEDDLRDQQ